MRHSLSQIAAKFWVDEDGSWRFHPLICHMLDVAAVAEAIWTDCLAARVRSHLSQALRLGEDEAGRWLAFLAGCHDLGKATPVFQAKGSRDQHSTPPWLKGTGLEFKPLGNLSDPGHGVVTAARLPALLNTHFAQTKGEDTATRLGVIAGGHHGIFPSASKRTEVTSTKLGEPKARCPNSWDEARKELVTTLADLVGVQGKPASPCNPASMLLAGFISVVDWIASIDDEEFFPYAPDGPQDLGAYLQCRRKRAREAVKGLHWDAWSRPKPPTSFKAVYPSIQPRPLQAAVQETAAAAEAPGLAIIEAPMGEGKTEAAFYLAECWNAGGLRGSYVAMPTQATSNQLYERFEQFLTRRYPNEKVNLQLLHGHASLHALKLLGNDESSYSPANIDADGRSAEATVGAAEWFTYRKRGLLAPFGVGTVDQALLSVLQVRHGFVRLFGLAGKTVIIDEVHAYDTYMSTLMERLLEWLAALGSPVVLLSATLPQAKRRDLLNAYGRGLGVAELTTLPGEAYPRITWATEKGVQARTCEASDEIRRQLGIEWFIAGIGGLPECLLDQLRGGGCAAVICNTVNRAQEVYVALRDAFAALPHDQRPLLDLFHARFLFKDREEREERCLKRFGKPDREDGTTAERPRRAVLVATQVVEQSLDLDFDFMISEIAPVDLLLQRSGRLHRHKRQDRRVPGAPVLQILAPERDEHGLPTFERGTTYVYDEHILLRTWHALQGRASIAIPEDVEGLIEAVYGEDSDPPEGASAALAERWRKTYETMKAKRTGQKALAKQPLIPCPNFDPEEFLEIPNAELLEDRPDAGPERRARTRLEELPSVRVVWLPPQEKSSAEIPATDRAAVQKLLRHSVELRGHWVPKLWGKEFLPDSWKTHPILRHCRQIVAGSTYEVRSGPRLLLDKEIGVVVCFNSLSSGEEVGFD
jgi:CRISPR-associated endonuclease/helicase Cas3